MNGKLRQFAKEICGGELVPLRYDPQPEAIRDHCFENSARYVLANGGEVAVGWAFAVMEGLIFAYHHGVWRSPSGELVDVTPHQDSAEVDWFVEDPSACLETVNGWRVSQLSKVKPVSKNKKLREKARRFLRYQWEENQELLRQVRSAPRGDEGVPDEFAQLLPIRES